MNVGLNETDILVALEKYVRDKYPIDPNEVITFEFKAGRKGNGPTAYAKFESDEIETTRTAQYGTVLVEDADNVPAEDDAAETCPQSDTEVVQPTAPEPTVETPVTPEPTVDDAVIEPPVVQETPVEETVSETPDTIDIEEAIAASSEPEEVLTSTADDTPVVDETENDTVMAGVEASLSAGLPQSEEPAMPADDSDTVESPFADTPAQTVAADAAASDLEQPETPSGDQTTEVPQPAEEPVSNDPIASIFD